MFEQTKAILLKSPTVRKVLTATKIAPQPVEHSVKQSAVKQLAKKYRTKTLIETGTYRGDMIEAMKEQFERIYSIELSRKLCKAAQRRFVGVDHVEIVCGDSAKELPKIVALLDAPALFWLDGHYSGGVTARGDEDTPVLSECECILTGLTNGHVIIVDDARLFGRDPRYPSLDQVREVVIRLQPDSVIEIADDSIRILPSP